MVNHPPKDRKLIIFGAGDFADIAYEYFACDSSYEVAAFTVDRIYLKESSRFGLQIVAFEEIEKVFPPTEFELFAAIVYTDLNRTRENVCLRAKAKGYRLASYVSSRSFVWPNVKLGEHCFVFEDNTIQPFVSVGDNVVFWSGNHIGHHSRIGSHCFLSSHVVVSGRVVIGEYCFLGVNSTLVNNITIGNRCWVSQGTCVSGDVPSGSLIKSVTSEVCPLNEKVLFRSIARASRRETH